MSPTPAGPVPRLLLFPQVGRPEADGRPGVRRYTLTLLSGARPPVRRGRAAAPVKPANP
jgi:hypothetical protein